MKRILSILLVGTMLLSTVPSFAAEQPIINNDFENGELGFSVRGTAAMEISTDTAHSGTSSMLIKDRGSNGWEGVNTSVINDIKLDETYYGQMYVKAATPGDSFTVKMSLDLEDATGSQYPQMASAVVNSNEWILIAGTWKADYQGNLNTINVDIETDDDGAGKSFYVDDVFFAHSSVSKPSTIITPQTEQTKGISYSGIEIPEDVAETSYLTNVEKLMALGVVNGYPDGTFKPENSVTRAEFLTMLLRLLKLEMTSGSTSQYTDVAPDHFAAGAIEWATNSGICDGYGDGLFGPEDKVTYAQAVKMLLGCMGYATVAESNGGYPDGYISAAAAEDIYVKGINDYNTPLTRAMTAELMVSALDVSLYLKDGSGNIVKDSSATILSEYYDGDIEKGYILSSNDVSTTDTTTGIDNVNIDGEVYNVGITRASELVGYYVEFIYTEDDGERTILYLQLHTSKTSEFELDPRDVESYNNYRYEYEDENGRIKHVDIEKDFTLVYNGKTLSDDYEDSMMTPELGTIKLVGTDSNNYNMVYITSYETFIVSSINKSTGYVYDLNGNKRKLNDDNGEITFIKPDGTEGELRDVVKNDILHIMTSADNDKTTVKIVRSNLEGSVGSIGDEEIIIDGTAYAFSKAYINRNYTAPNLGTTVTAYFDMNGEVVYIEEGSDTSMEVGYLLSAAILESGDELQVRYFSSDGELKTVITDGRLKIDGKSYSQDDISETLDVIIGNGTDGKVEKRIFRYTTDNKGKLNKLDFARAKEACTTEAEKNEGEQTLYALNSSYIANNGKENAESSTAVKYKYKYNARTFIDESGNYASLALRPDTVIFVVPDENSGSESDYDEYDIKSVSNIGYDEQHKVFAYKISTDGITADYAVLFVNNKGDENLSSKEGYVVTKITSALNRDDEAVPCFEVYQNGSKKEYVLKNMDIYDEAVALNDNQDIKKGDIIRFDVDSSGQISNFVVDKGKGKYNDYFYSAQGYIYLKEDGYAYFTTKKPNASSSVDDMILIPIDDFKITVYNKRTEEIYEGVSAEIIDYNTDPEAMSQVYITMNYENAATLICIMDE